MKVYQRIAQLLMAIENCQARDNKEWFGKHSKLLDKLIRDRAPGGSGFDNGTKLDTKSSPNELIFLTNYHRMDEEGCYEDWINLRVIATPDLFNGFALTIEVVKCSTDDTDNIEGYVDDVFRDFLEEEII